MAMSEKRKKAQDKLRKKYNYKTNTNYERGTILYKKSVDPDFNPADNDKIIYDINIIMNKQLLFTKTEESNDIIIQTSSYYDAGFCPEDVRYKHIMDHEIVLSLEELDLIHEIAHQMAEENDWKKQIKNYKKQLKERDK